MHDHMTEGKMPLYTNAFERFVLFFFVAMGVVAVTYGILFAVDFLPEPPEEANSALAIEATESKPEQVIEEEPVYVEPLPVSIIFDSLDREVEILNPVAHDVATLDAALLEGVVRHPDSADFQTEGTIFLLGHSSYLPKVINKNFQAFNGIQKLAWGDTIRLKSIDTEYVYRVDRVYQAKASAAEVEIDWGTPKLTLATCNSFGSKDDRYIVEATLVERYAI